MPLLSNKEDHNIYIKIQKIYIFSSLISLLCCLKPPEYYDSLFLLPLSFIICASTIIRPIVNARFDSITFNLIYFTLFLRYVILPIVITFDPPYSVSHYTCKDALKIFTAISYMVYELFVVSMFLYFYYSRHSKELIYSSPQKANLNIQKTTFLLFLGVLITAGVVVISPNALNSISFLKIDVDSGERLGEAEISTNTLILRQLFVVGVLLVFIALSCISAQIDRRSSSIFHLIIPLLSGMICIGMIIGEQRSSQVYTCFATVLLISALFPRYKKTATRILIVSAIIILVLISIYKMFFAFSYGSYLEAIAATDSSEYTIGYTAEIYLLGPITVSAVIDLYNNSYPEFTTLFFDFMRSTMGLHLFVKDMSIESSSVLFNKFVTGTSMITNGYLLPISGNGLLYLTPIFGPFLLILIYRIGFFIEKVMKKTHSPIIFFFCAYVLIRYGTCMLSSNLNTVLTMSSLIAIFVIPIYFIDKLFKRETKRIVE